MNDDALKNFKKSRRLDCLQYENFDKKYNLDTGGPIVLSKDNSGEYVPGGIKNNDRFFYSNGFQNTAIDQIDEINSFLQKTIKISDYNFIDFGSGKGRVLFYNQIHNIGYKSLIGLEVDPLLYETSLSNAEIIPGPIFYNMDATKFDLPKGKNIIFVFNPFLISLWKEYLSQLNVEDDLIIASVAGFGEVNPYTLVVLNEPELDYGFEKIYENNLIYIYKKI